MAKGINLFLAGFIFSSLLFSQEENLPESVQQFLYNNETAPFGVVHPEAHKEIKDFEQLTGIWLCKTHAYFQGEWYEGWPAFWAFKYILDGFAVQDLWYQLEEDLAPPLKYLERNYAGTNIRIYDYSKEKVSVFWAQNSTPNESPAPSTSAFEGNFSDDKFVMIKNDSTRRITFSEVTDSTFNWMAEQWIDSTNSWKAVLKITAERIN